MAKIIPESELILNADGSVYHLKLLPEDLADTVITVGDPDRVPLVSQYFDEIEIKKQKREIVTHTGRVGNKRISVLSTGMGTDNIDIVLTELDALVNIDLKKRVAKDQLRSLDIVRLGTAGALQNDIQVDDVVASTYAVGFDGMLHSYQTQASEFETQLCQVVDRYFEAYAALVKPYVSSGAQTLVERFTSFCVTGLTATCNGFYGPQARHIRIEPAFPDLLDKMSDFNYETYRFANFEMETSGIYGLASALGHRACSLSAIVANRKTGKFSRDPKAVIDKMIRQALAALT